METEKSRVFVYGTLKKGFFNYNAYLQRGIDSKQAVFVGNGVTGQKFRLVVGDDRNVPFLLAPSVEAEDDVGEFITGEIYDVDAQILAGLDMIEGVATGYYSKEKIPVSLADGSCTCEAYVYMKTTYDSILAELPFLSNYSMALHHNYKPRTEIPNQRILDTMYGVNS